MQKDNNYYDCITYVSRGVESNAFQEGYTLCIFYVLLYAYDMNHNFDASNHICYSSSSTY